MRFTKASKTDGAKVTTTLTEVYDYLTSTCDDFLLIAKTMKLLKSQGQLVILTVENVPTAFYVNRAGQTLCTNSFPGKLRRPQVGHAVNYGCNGVYDVVETEGYGD